MTLLGHHNPLLRLANAARGLLRQPVPRGRRSVVHVVGHEERLRELVRLGVDGILTDEPALLRGIAGGRPNLAESVLP